MRNTGMRIGEAYYETIEDATIECDCGHKVLLNQAQLKKELL